MRLEGQTLGLAGVFQAVRLVLDLAREGRCDDAALNISLGSILAVDSDSPAAAFGGVAQLTRGLDLLVAQLEGSERDRALLGIVGSVMNLARKLGRQQRRRESLRSGIEAARRSADALGLTNDSVVARLAELYIEAISTMKPRVMVPGNGLYLSQPRVVARIRALLLAAVRAGVLWQQMGGSSFALILRRRRLVAEARRLRAEC